ncbi:YjcZ family sporulation protein [Chengkuizengella sp. SCS-71B]
MSGHSSSGAALVLVLFILLVIILVAASRTYCPDQLMRIEPDLPARNPQ